MRSKIGTKTRLAAHLLALVLLIFMLVYIPPQVASEHRTRPVRQVTAERRPIRERDREAEPPLRPATAAARTDQALSHDPAATLDRVHVAPGRAVVPTEKLRPPATTETGIVPAAAGTGVASAAVTPPPVSTAVPVAPDRREATTVVPVPVPVEPRAAPTETVPSSEDAPAGATGSAPATEIDSGTVIESVTATPVTTDENVSAPIDSDPAGAAEAVPPADASVTEDESPAGSGTTEAAVVDDSPATADAPSESSPSPVPESEDPPVSQPDESGALVVAETPPVRAAQLLPNASLEVLGAGVYWLDPRHDLEQELAAIPEVGGLVLLTPLPGYQSTGFPHLKTEVLPADPADLTIDAAEHFLDLTTAPDRPVVVAMLPGARGAAFFKGVYFLRNRNLPLDDVLRELEPELQEAGGARDAIIHRLIRFNEDTFR
ncbi:MAG: hypothetical protein LUG50_13805 [Planctomycetaceae bacterium]|nr:hypothetical protein [Planctomycetaceae bacterium]